MEILSSGSMGNAAETIAQRKSKLDGHVSVPKLMYESATTKWDLCAAEGADPPGDGGGCPAVDPHPSILGEWLCKPYGLNQSANPKPLNLSSRSETSGRSA
jgi:hypothetical protein